MAETRYSKDHEYIRIEGDVGTVGISDYAQSQLGDVVFVELEDALAVLLESRVVLSDSRHVAKASVGAARLGRGAGAVRARCWWHCRPT